MLWRSVENLRHPSVDPAAVRSLAAELPNDPNAIRAAVLTRIVPYAYDWRVDGVPWYFPTTAQALRAGRGDCESQAIVLASILKAKGIPYQLRMSFDHIWVQYPGKQANTLENAGVAFAEQKNGRFVFHWPADFNLWKEARDQVQIYWTPMPLARKLLLFGGILVLLFLNPLLGPGAAPAGRRRPSPARRRRPAPGVAGRPRAGGRAGKVGRTPVRADKVEPRALKGARGGHVAAHRRARGEARAVRRPAAPRWPGARRSGCRLGGPHRRGR